MLKKIFQGSFIYTLGTQAPLVANLFILPLLTPYLTAKDYAVWGLTFAYIGGLSAFKDLGMYVIAFNAYYKYPLKYKFIWRKVLGFLWMWGIPYVMVVALLVMLTIRRYAPDDILFIVFFSCAPILLFDPVNTLGFRYFQLKQQPFKIFMVSMVVTLLTIAINYYCIRVLKMGYKAWFISSFTGAGVSFIYYAYFVVIKERVTPLFRIKYHWVKKTFRVSLPTIPHYYSTYLLNFSDRLLLDVNKVNTTSIGHYNIAYNFGNYFMALQQSISFVVNPIFFTLFKEDTMDAEKKVRHLTFLWTAISMAIGFFLCIWSKEIFHFLYRSEDLKDAYVYAPIILMSFVSQPMYLASLSKTVYFEKTSSLMKITGVAGVLNVILNLIFIPMFGIWASVIITFVTYVYMSFSAFYIKSFNYNQRVSYYPTFWLVGIIMVMIGGYFAPEAPIAVKGIITGVMTLIPLLFFSKIKAIVTSLNKTAD